MSKLIVAMTPAEVYATVGTDQDTVQAMVRAEKYGAAQAHGANISLAGYIAHSAELNASTALYRVTY